LVSQPPVGELIGSSAPSASMTCSLELSLPSPAGIWFKTLLSVGDTNTPTTQCGFRGWECGGCQQSEDCGIPTKPVGGLLSNIGKERHTGPPLNCLTSLPEPPCYTPLQARPRATISALQQEWNLLPEGLRRVMRMTWCKNTRRVSMVLAIGTVCQSGLGRRGLSVVSSGPPGTLFQAR